MTRFFRFTALAAVLAATLAASQTASAQYGGYRPEHGGYAGGGYGDCHRATDYDASVRSRPAYDYPPRYAGPTYPATAICDFGRRPVAPFPGGRIETSARPLPQAALGMWEVNTGALGARRWLEFKADATFAIHTQVVAPGARPQTQAGLPYAYDGRTLTLSGGQPLSLALMGNQLLLADAADPTQVQALVRSAGPEDLTGGNPQPINPQPIINPQPVNPQLVNPQPTSPLPNNLPTLHGLSGLPRSG